MHPVRQSRSSFNLLTISGNNVFVPGKEGSSEKGSGSGSGDKAETEDKVGDDKSGQKSQS